jgi:coenzyme F420-reducing hydrogenase alpha subunit
MDDILVDPLTRILGNASVRILRGEQGAPPEARFQAFGYRGFEQFIRGADLDNLLPLVSRICGADSAFHQIGAAMAAERALGIDVPEAAADIRELAMWAQLFERHAVSLTIHSLPDLLFPSSGQNLRSILSIHKVDEEVVQRVMDLKLLGTAVLQEAGARAVHPVNFVPGGAVRDIPDGKRKTLVERLAQAEPLLLETCRLLKMLLRRNEEVIKGLGMRSTSFLALSGAPSMRLTGSELKALGPGGEEVEKLRAAELPERCMEYNTSYSHVRSVEIKGLRELRTGPLARLNVNGSYGSRLADEELEDIKSQWGFPLQQNMLAHMARMLEMMHAWERMRELLDRPQAASTRKPVPAGEGSGESVIEAPEGLLSYRLKIGGEGTIEEIGIISPLQFNVNALEASITEAAVANLGPGAPDEQTLGLIEMAVRAYAPCPMCGLH